MNLILNEMDFVQVDTNRNGFKIDEKKKKTKYLIGCNLSDKLVKVCNKLFVKILCLISHLDNLIDFIFSIQLIYLSNYLRFYSTSHS